jgi:acyl-CoA thioesterase FadM
MHFDPANPPKLTFLHRSMVAFDELDMQGILHHSRHLLHVERACHAFFEKVMDAPGFRPDIYPDLHAVVRSLKIEYLIPLGGVRPILVALRVVRLRSCTMTTAFELRSIDGQTVFSRGERETCRVKIGELRPGMWSDQYLERFGAWLDSANAPAAC